VASVVAVTAGQELALPRDGSAQLDPGASLRVEIAVPLTDARLALHDEADAMVVSTGTTEIGGATTRLRLTPAEPLRPGSTYLLRLDGATTREAHDATGRAYAPFTLKLRTTGERPPPPPKKRGKRRR
jgi:hypothetical protein